jgi:1,2-diacylglycerol 3-beta-galactosyltransferase
MILMSQNNKPHILFLFSDTGGGHRSAAEAIIEALQLEYGDAVTTEMLDFFKGYAPLPLNKMPDWYPDMVKAPQLWGLSFKISDGRRRARAITASMWPYVGRAVRRIVKEHPADLIVTVHPVATTVFLKALGRNRPPFIIVVTDLVTTHALWYDQRADLILVPTEQARQRAIEYTMDPERVRVVGQPVAERYCVPAGNKETLRKKLGWEKDKTIVLLVGGGEGMGPLGKTARAIAASGLNVALAIVCGRNQRLKKHLESLHWQVPVHIYGFTREMPDFMRAADVLVTKAGPGTIAESLNAHLPMILYAKLPGQEDGNVTFVVEEKVGVWAPQPKRVVQTLSEWVQEPEIRLQYVENCRCAARLDASRQIARAIGETLELTSEKAVLERLEDKSPV